MCPGHRAVARAPPEHLVASVSLRRSVLPSPQHGGFGLWSCRFRGHLCVHFRYGPTTRSPSRRWLCRSTSCASFPLHLRSKLRGLTFVPMGLPPTEHICLVWTYRAVPTTPPECPAASVSARQAMRPSPDHRGLGLRILLFCRGHLWVYSRYGPVTCSPSRGWLCRLASSVSFPPRMQPKLQGS